MKYKLPLFITFLFGAFYGIHGYFRYMSFELPVAWDFLMSSHVSHSLLHEGTWIDTAWSSIRGTHHLLKNHFNISLLLFTPIYFFFQNAIAHIITTAVCISVTGFMLFRIAELFIANRLTCLLLLILFLSNSIVTTFYETEAFHNTILAMALISVAAWYFMNYRFGLFLLFFVLAMLCRETVPLSVFGFGLLALVQRRKSRWILAPIFGGLGYFILVTHLIMPNIDQLSGGNYASESGGSYGGSGTDFFNYLGTSMGEVVRTLLTNPTQTSMIVTSSQSKEFYDFLLSPFLYLGLLAPEFLLIPIGDFAINILAPELALRGRYFICTYVFGAVAGIVGFCRFVFMLRYLLTGIGLTRVNRFVAPSVGAVLVIFSAGPQMSNFFFSKAPDIARAVTQDLKTPFHKALDEIPLTRAVAAHQSFTNYLVNRNDLRFLTNRGECTVVDPFSEVNFVGSQTEVVKSHFGADWYGVRFFPDGKAIFCEGWPRESLKAYQGFLEEKGALNRRYFDLDQSKTSIVSTVEVFDDQRMIQANLSSEFTISGYPKIQSKTAVVSVGASLLADQYNAKIKLRFDPKVNDEFSDELPLVLGRISSEKRLTLKNVSPGRHKFKVFAKYEPSFLSIFRRLFGSESMVAKFEIMDFEKLGLESNQEVLVDQMDFRGFDGKGEIPFSPKFLDGNGQFKVYSISFSLKKTSDVSLGLSMLGGGVLEIGKVSSQSVPLGEEHEPIAEVVIGSGPNGSLLRKVITPSDFSSFGDFQPFEFPIRNQENRFVDLKVWFMGKGTLLTREVSFEERLTL